MKGPMLDQTHIKTHSYSQKKDPQNKIHNFFTITFFMCVCYAKCIIKKITINFSI